MDQVNDIVRINGHGISSSAIRATSRGLALVGVVGWSDRQGLRQYRKIVQSLQSTSSTRSRVLTLAYVYHSHPQLEPLPSTLASDPLPSPDRSRRLPPSRVSVYARWVGKRVAGLGEHLGGAREG